MTVDFAMNKTFGVSRAPSRIDGLTAQIEFHDVVGSDEAWCHASRKPKAIGMQIMARADVAVAIKHRLRIQDAIGGDQVRNRLHIRSRAFGDSRLPCRFTRVSLRFSGI